jgi:hypothetical protein
MEQEIRERERERQSSRMAIKPRRDVGCWWNLQTNPLELPPNNLQDTVQIKLGLVWVAKIPTNL